MAVEIRVAETLKIEASSTTANVGQSVPREVVSQGLRQIAPDPATAFDADGQGLRNQSIATGSVTILESTGIVVQYLWLRVSKPVTLAFKQGFPGVSKTFKVTSELLIDMTPDAGGLIYGLTEITVLAIANDTDVRFYWAGSFIVI